MVWKQTLASFEKYPHSNDTSNFLFYQHWLILLRWREKEIHPVFDKPACIQVKTFVKPQTKWKNSAGKRILFDSVNNERVLLEQIKTVTKKRKCHSKNFSDASRTLCLYFKRFTSWLLSIRNTIKNLHNRANEDQEALNLFAQNNKELYGSKKRCIQWQGSKFQKLLLEDIDSIVHDHYAGKYGIVHFKTLTLQQPNLFWDMIHQKIRTAYDSKSKTKGKVYQSPLTNNQSNN